MSPPASRAAQGSKTSTRSTRFSPPPPHFSHLKPRRPSEIAVELVTDRLAEPGRDDLDASPAEAGSTLVFYISQRTSGYQGRRWPNLIVVEIWKRVNGPKTR